ncbi:MAG: HD domain-containing protein [Bacilli bacterium]|nr:HD domain-containing protein [Bacilli bacterium]
MNINKDLQNYIEDNVFSDYEKNEEGHRLDHIKYVIDRSFKFASTIPDINYDMVYVIAAYHDIGHHIDAKRHEIISAEIMEKDINLKKYFSCSELKIIKEAIEDHRASSNHEPRSIYGKIISTADRNNTVEDCLKRSYTYGKVHTEGLTDDELFERAYHALVKKFGYNGYAKFYFEDNEYNNFLKDIRKLLEDKENFCNVQREYIKKLKKDGIIKE